MIHKRSQIFVCVSFCHHLSSFLETLYLEGPFCARGVLVFLHGRGCLGCWLWSHFAIEVVVVPVISETITTV